MPVCRAKLGTAYALGAAANSGAVKITPAHDFNDFEVGRRHDLPQVSILDTEAKLDLRDNAAFLEDVPASAALEASSEAPRILVHFDEALGYIKTAAGQMDRMIGAILKVSREGKRAFRPEPLDVMAVVGFVAETQAHQAQAAGA